ncbi:MAG: hypothetical protein ACI9RY_000076, partial [Reinekea sp.]
RHDPGHLRGRGFEPQKLGFGLSKTPYLLIFIRF